MKNFARVVENASRDELRLLLSVIEKKLENGRPSGDWQAARTAQRYLDTKQLADLTAAFADWRVNARAPAQIRSRTRIWLAYLLLRYGGLRLGEVLGLDDRRDIDFNRCQVILPGPFARVVQIPLDTAHEMRLLLDEPMFYGMRGAVLRIDPGYLRRKFYEQAALAGLPREVVNPRVLRHSRGMELLSGGVPPEAVSFFLGRQNRAQSNGFEEFSQGTGQRIVQQYLNKEHNMKTSARNVFMGNVSHLAHDGLLAEVELTTLSGLKIVAMLTEESRENLRITEGSVVTASIKASWVELAVPDAGEEVRSSARIRLAGKVTHVKEGGLATEVLVDLHGGGGACALITSSSAKRLGLAPGKEVLVMFKAFSVIINAES